MIRSLVVIVSTIIGDDFHLGGGGTREPNLAGKTLVM